jgi:type III restriction enzyme
MKETLHEIINSAKENGFIDLPEIPDYIASNLKHELRDYQVEAVSRFLWYPEYQARVYPTHLLFNMATGSGKTMIMAALMLELYKRGQNNFWFFVNSTNIIQKTLDNFTNPTSSKYQFSDKIEFDGVRVSINIVENFESASHDAINIKFSTVQALHTDLHNPRENQITAADFGDKSVVMIADEAHHLNASTKKKKLTGSEEVQKSWEDSVQEILGANSDNMLLEFTATVNWNNADIYDKYENKLLYQYDLRSFRKAGFSKDVFVYQFDDEIYNGMLRAAIISQYRQRIAKDYGINLKPVVLFKSKGTNANSKGTSASKDAFNEFNDMIKNLTTEQIVNEFAKTSTNSDMNDEMGSDIFSKAKGYFENMVENLVDELRREFDVDSGRVLLHDGTNARSSNQDKLVNSLESLENPVRAIFAVNMLDEGWDVLNLFDIVRLYEGRDGETPKGGNYRPGTTTLSEMQLIGRGARYYPFLLTGNDNSQRFTRKYDDNQAHPLRVIEQMHYYSKYDTRYISELRQVLDQEGITEPKANVQPIQLELKYEFQNSSAYKDGVVWKNTKYPKREAYSQKVPEFEPTTKLGGGEIHKIDLLTGVGQQRKVFDIALEASDIKGAIKNSDTKRLDSFISSNIIKQAINHNRNWTYDKINEAYPDIESICAFMKLLGEEEVQISGIFETLNDLPASQKMLIVSTVLKRLEPELRAQREKTYGSHEFKPFPIATCFRNIVVRNITISDGDKEFGRSQNNSYSGAYALNLAEKDWYSYNDNFGTSEEKAFVKLFDSLYSEVQALGYANIYLIRNEKAVTLFELETGAGFEPDYVLFMEKPGDRLVLQIIIEPKGDWAYDAREGDFGKEEWKQQFLMMLSQITADSELKVGNKFYKVIGLPFCNGKHTAREFRESFEKVVKADFASKN